MRENVAFFICLNLYAAYTTKHHYHVRCATPSATKYEGLQYLHCCFLYKKCRMTLSCLSHAPLASNFRIGLLLPLFLRFGASAKLLRNSLESKSHEIRQFVCIYVKGNHSQCLRYQVTIVIVI